MFHDVRLPEDVERGASGGPGFRTSIVTTVSGREQRNIEWQLARAVWEIGYGLRDSNDYTELLDFFYARRGRAYGFRFKDWTDYTTGLETLGLGDGSNRNFQLFKTYIDTALNYTRPITRPVVGSIIGVKVAGVAAGYVLNPLGIINLNVAPAIGAVVTVDSFEFDVPVRFDMDNLMTEVEWVEAGSNPDITVIEIRE